MDAAFLDREVVAVPANYEILLSQTRVWFDLKADSVKR